MSNILDLEETRKIVDNTQSKNARNENRHSGQVSGKSMEIVKGVIQSFFVHINKGIHPRCLLLKGEIILCLYLHVFTLLLYFFVSLIGNLDQNNDIFCIICFFFLTLICRVGSIYKWRSSKFCVTLLQLCLWIAKDENVSFFYYLHT